MGEVRSFPNTETLALIGRKLSDALPKLVPEKERAEREDLFRTLRLLEEIAAANYMAFDRIANLVRSLKTFAALDEAPVKSVDLHDALESTLALLQNQLSQKAEVVREYEALPAVECRPGQINQLFMNLLLNAIQAIPEKGTIYVRTEGLGDKVRISIRDTATGSVQQRQGLCDPTLTQQGNRVGVDLDSSIACQIVYEHGGEDPGREYGVGWHSVRSAAHKICRLTGVESREESGRRLSGDAVRHRGLSPARSARHCDIPNVAFSILWVLRFMLETALWLRWLTVAIGLPGESSRNVAWLRALALEPDICSCEATCRCVKEMLCGASGPTRLLDSANNTWR